MKRLIFLLLLVLSFYPVKGKDIIYLYNDGGGCEVRGTIYTVPINGDDNISTLALVDQPVEVKYLAQNYELQIKLMIDPNDFIVEYFLSNISGMLLERGEIKQTTTNICVEQYTTDIFFLTVRVNDDAYTYKFIR